MRGARGAVGTRAIVDKKYFNYIMIENRNGSSSNRASLVVTHDDGSTEDVETEVTFLFFLSRFYF